MSEFRFLKFVIIFLELAIFACGIKIVYNRHHARNLFIQLEREQQSYNVLLDEKSELRVEIATLSQPGVVEQKAKEQGLSRVDNNAVVVLHIPPQGSALQPANDNSGEQTQLANNAIAPLTPATSKKVRR